MSRDPARSRPRLRRRAIGAGRAQTARGLGSIATQGSPRGSQDPRGRRRRSAAGGRPSERASPWLRAPHKRRTRGRARASLAASAAGSRRAPAARAEPHARHRGTPRESPAGSRPRRGQAIRPRSDGPECRSEAGKGRARSSTASTLALSSTNMSHLLRFKRDRDGRPSGPA